MFLSENTFFWFWIILVLILCNIFYISILFTWNLTGMQNFHVFPFPGSKLLDILRTLTSAWKSRSNRNSESSLKFDTRGRVYRFIWNVYCQTNYYIQWIELKTPDTGEPKAGNRKRSSGNSSVKQNLLYCLKY